MTTAQKMGRGTVEIPSPTHEVVQYYLKLHSNELKFYIFNVGAIT